MEERKKILVVDDERLNINVLVDLLKPDYKMIAAKSGEQALKAARSSNPPDLILLDIMMPGMDGYEVCRQLKANEATRDIPLIFITAMGETSDETKGLEMGAVDYITKPISPPIVKARVRTHLEIKRQRDELVETARHLEQLNQDKNRFLGMAAHDLRNPLVSIRGFSEFLLEGEFGPLNEDQIEFTDMIHRASEDMLFLVNDLLDVSVIESGKLTMNIESCSLGVLLEERLAINRVAADKKDIKFHSSFEDVSLVRIDPKRIAQVIDNLIGNAVKFSLPGANIYVSTSAANDGVEVSVRDEGPGLSPEDRQKLFGEFQKLSARPTADEKSTGLGLAIVKKIMEAHGGSVDVESELGSGSIFHFTVPLED